MSYGTCPSPNGPLFSRRVWKDALASALDPETIREHHGHARMAHRKEPKLSSFDPCMVCTVH